MQRRSILIAVAGAFALGAGCAVSGCSNRDGGSRQTIIVGGNSKATRVDHAPLALTAGRRLIVRNADGKISVRVGDGPPEVTASWTASGKADADAQAALAGANLLIEPDAQGVVVTVQRTTSTASNLEVTRIGCASADLELRVPRDITLEITAQSGTLEVVGPVGAAQLATSYGDVTIEEANGDVTANSSSGNVTIRSVGGSVHATTSYGDVAIEQAKGATIEAKTVSGSVELDRVDAEHLTAECSYGDVKVRGGSGELRAKTSSGAVVVDGFHGSIDGRSSYGDVTLRVPTDFSAKIDATTDYGSVESRLDLTDAQWGEERKSLHARVGSGECAVTLATSSGDITLSRSSR